MCKNIRFIYFYNIYYLDLLSYSKFQQKLPISQDILMVLAMNKFSMYCTVLAQCMTPLFSQYSFSLSLNHVLILLWGISVPRPSCTITVSYGGGGSSRPLLMKQPLERSAIFALGFITWLHDVLVVAEAGSLVATPMFM